MLSRIRTSCLVWGLLSGLILAQSAEPLSHARRLRVATWNLLNLFDNYDEPDKPDEGTAPKSGAELAAMARVIDEMDADILGVQEVENRRALEMLNQYLDRPYLWVEVIEGNDHRGIDVGLLSRFPIERVTSHRMQALTTDHRFARDLPVFRVRYAPERVVDIGVIHLKSKRGAKAESDAWRLAEATGIRRILEASRKVEPEVPVLLMGDFNDTRLAGTLDPVFSWMEDLTKQIPVDQRYTFTHDGQGEQIDFILQHGALPLRGAQIVRPEDNPSDHAPVFVNFDAGVDLVRVESPAGQRAPRTKPPELHVNDLQGLRSHVLKEVAMTGKVVAVHRPRGGRSASLNFHEDYRKAGVVYIPPSALDRFEDLDALVGKKVRVTGPVSLYKETPQVTLTRRDQLQVLP
ncbi:MAG: endonuclease/exonuclease/phosphatase family protein [Planctomycetes bacterium]|nr:endonuclease/exonuclease/phosphatase family protein [Planctomycetota bacterium]